MARLHPKTGAHRPRRPRRAAALGLVALLVLASLAGLALVPTTSARAAYEGPGMAGMVPRGDGGADARNQSLGENLTTITLTGLPEDLCRLELVADQGTHVLWPAPAPVPRPDPGALPEDGDPNNTSAYADETAERLVDHTDNATPDPTRAKVYAEFGTEDAPWQVRAHWTLDLKGACTVETTEEGTTWHDPWGRPFSILWGKPKDGGHEIPQDGNGTIHATLGNLGTIPTRVALDTDTLRPGWNVTFHGPVDNITLGPNATHDLSMTVQVPKGTRVSQQMFDIWWTVHDTGEHDRFPVAFQVIRAAADPPRDPWYNDADAFDERVRDAAQKQADETVDDVQESPALLPFTVLLVALAVAWRTRRLRR